ncbi:MAG: lamin tail domain-containing protein [Phycisphaerae bacterium]|nr:lamin tail domain-containing protein [Phycisphaerae bacterium]
MKTKLLIFIVLLVTNTNIFVSANSLMLPGDINDDNEVDLFDLELLAENWLTQNSSVNLVGTNLVDLRDFQILTDNWQRQAPKLIINEFLASNSSVYADEDGDYEDWIEIKNQSSEAINLDGYYLTDKQDNLTKWPLPAIDISPGELLVVFASEKDRRIAGQELHANFKLKASGEFLALVNPDGKVEHAFMPEYPGQQENISFGLYQNQQFYFTVPTPNSDNNTGFRAFVDNPEFSIDRGFFEEAIVLEINCNTPYAFIKYTTDGSKPTEGNGLYYNQPITIDSTTVLRAAAFRAQYVSSEIITSTYIYPEDIINQSAVQAGYPSQWQTRIHEGSQTIDTFQADFEMDPAIVNSLTYGPLLIDALKSLPTISLVTDVNNLFDLETGIYIHAVEPAGNIYGDVPADWERPTSVELIFPDGQVGFQVDAGLRMQGSASRRPMNPKHSFRLLFKDEYGPGRLKFPLFGDNAARSFNTLALRGGFNDAFTIWASSQSSKATFLSDQFARDSQLAMGNPAARGTFVHLYINGLYWGLYNPSERLDSDFQSDYLGGEPEDYDVIKHKVQVIDGNKDAWNQAISLAGQGLSTSQAYQDIQQYIDVQSNADYMLLNFFLGTTDWPGNNWYMARNTAAETGFKCFIWDAEQSLKSVTSDRTGVNNSNSPAFFYDKLRANEEYRVLFGDRAHKFLFNNGALTKDKCQERYSQRINEISAAIIAESARWGDAHVNPAYNLNDNWLPRINFVMNDLFPDRGDILLGQLKNKGLYPEIDAPIFLINEVYQHGGYANAGDKLSMNYNQSQSYVDIELISINAPVLTHVPLDDSLSLNWTLPDFIPNNTWTDGGTTAVGYDTKGGYDALINTDVEDQMYEKSSSVYCLIEFDYDTSVSLEELKLHIKYDDAFIAYLNGTEVCRSNNITSDIPPLAASSSHEVGTDFEIFDITNFKHLLNRSGNVLALHGINIRSTSSDLLLLPKLIGSAFLDDGNGASVYYTNNSSDPRLQGGQVAPDAQKYTSHIQLNNSSHIKARTYDNGNWSALCETTYALGNIIDSLRITEIMYHPAEPNTEFVEFCNIAVEPINLNLVKFTNGIDFAFEDTILLPGQYAIIVQDRTAFENKYGSNLNVIGQYQGRLDNDSDHIKLIDAIGLTITEFTYEDEWYDITDGPGYSLTLVDPINADPTALSNISSWQPSTTEGGSPGN